MVWILKSKWTLEAIAAPQQLEQQLVGRLQAHQEKERKIRVTLEFYIHNSKDSEENGGDHRNT